MCSKNPRISIIMPVYNGENTVTESILSVLHQTFEDFELIVIDDGSGDTSPMIIDQFATEDSRIIVKKNSVNSGVSFSRNLGVSLARGKWICFLDSDDLWSADKLQKQLEYMEKMGGVLGYTASSFIYEDNSSSSYIMRAEEKIPYSTLLKKNIISCSSVMVRADTMKGLTMPGDFMHEDYYTWLKILEKERYAFGIDEPMLIYRLSKKSKSANRISSARMNFNTYRAVGYSKVTSLLFMLRYAVYSIHKRFSIKYATA